VGWGGSRSLGGSVGGKRQAAHPPPKGPMALVWDPSSWLSWPGMCRRAMSCSQRPGQETLQDNPGNGHQGRLYLPLARSLAGGGGPHPAEAKSPFCSRLGPASLHWPAADQHCGPPAQGSVRGGSPREGPGAAPPEPGKEQRAASPVVFSGASSLWVTPPAMAGQPEDKTDVGAYQCWLH